MPLDRYRNRRFNRLDVIVAHCTRHQTRTISRQTTETDVSTRVDQNDMPTLYSEVLLFFAEE